MGIRKIRALILYLPPDAITLLLTQNEKAEEQPKASPIDQAKALAQALRARPMDGG